MMALVVWGHMLLSGCTHTPQAPDTAPPTTECVRTVSWQAWGQGFFMTWCQACHSQTTSARNGAPEGIDFDTEAQVLTLLDAVSETVLVSRSMPVGGGPDADDLTLLSIYLDELRHCAQAGQ